MSQPPQPWHPATPPPPPAPPELAATPAFAPPIPPKTRTGLIVGLTLAAVVLLCCLPGFGGLIGLGVYTYQATKAESVAAVDGYLTHVKAGEFTEAYAMLCQQSRDAQSMDVYVQRQVAQPTLQSYQVGEAQPAENGGFVVDANLVFVNGERRTERYTVVLEADELRICL